VLLTTGAVALGLLGTAGAPSAVADQSDAGQLRVTIGAAPRAQANFDVEHQMTLKANSANWSEKFYVSKVRTTRAGSGVAVNITAASAGGTKATSTSRRATFSAAARPTAPSATRPASRPTKINPKAKTTYAYTFTTPGYSPGA